MLDVLVTSCHWLEEITLVCGSIFSSALAAVASVSESGCLLSFTILSVQCMSLFHILFNFLKMTNFPDGTDVLKMTTLPNWTLFLKLNDANSLKIDIMN